MSNAVAEVIIEVMDELETFARSVKQRLQRKFLSQNVKRKEAEPAAVAAAPVVVAAAVEESDDEAPAPAPTKKQKKEKESAEPKDSEKKEKKEKKDKKKRAKSGFNIWVMHVSQFAKSLECKPNAQSVMRVAASMWKNGVSEELKAKYTSAAVAGAKKELDGESNSFNIQGLGLSDSDLRGVRLHSLLKEDMQKHPLQTMPGKAAPEAAAVAVVVEDQESGSSDDSDSDDDKAPVKKVSVAKPVAKPVVSAPTDSESDSESVADSDDLENLWVNIPSQLPKPLGSANKPAAPTPKAVSSAKKAPPQPFAQSPVPEKKKKDKKKHSDEQ